MSKKHKHRKHKCCNGGNEHHCGENCQCSETTKKVEINTEAELYALLNLIVKNGEERSKREQKSEDNLANAMLEDVMDTT